MWTRRFIAAVQIVGALIGVWMLVLGARNGVSIVWALILAMFIFVGIAGVELWRGTRRGLIASTIAQIIQIPWIASAHFTWRMAAGLGMWIAWRSDATERAFFQDRCFGTSYLLEMRQGFGAWVDQAPVVLGINLIALVAAVFLMKRIWLKQRA
jgi:hypothetical protein